jgi:hypothetical protein
VSNVINFDKFRHHSIKIKTAQTSEDLEHHVSKFDRALTRHRKYFRKHNIRISDAKANIVVLESLLKMTLGLIGIAEQQFHKYKNERSAYCINALSNQVREIMNDLRQLRTGDKQHKEIINRIIIPNLSVLMQQYMANCTDLKKHINQLDRKQRQPMLDALTATMQQQGNLFNEASTKMQQQLAEYLVA